MIDFSPLFCFIEKSGINFFSGVPDSLTATLISELENYVRSNQGLKLVPAANEGTAVSMSIGSFLANGKPGIIYMQNSGLGNAINPLLSIAHSAVFNIPIILLIGWRGEPSLLDEPQHLVQGDLTLGFLGAIGARHEVIRNNSNFENALNRLEKLLTTGTLGVFAIVFSREAFI